MGVSLCPLELRQEPHISGALSGVSEGSIDTRTRDDDTVKGLNRKVIYVD